MSTILIVDDDSFLLDMYALKFGENAYTVDTAKSVEEALKKLRNGTSFDIILLDMIMPHLTGLDLLKAIKAESLGGDPLCIVLSNQGERTDIEAANEAGADGYIIKANSIPSEVVRSVKEYAEKKASAVKQK
jgi:CheY-like chemotaxis protein